MSKKLKHSFFDHNNREAKALREACMEVTPLRFIDKVVRPSIKRWAGYSYPGILTNELEEDEI